MKQIILTVKPDGECILETEGFNGPICTQESEFLKKALGEEVEHTLKPCYFNKEGESNKIQRSMKPLCG